MQARDGSVLQLQTKTAMSAKSHRWGLILAGGEGRRLRAVSELVGGRGCPKQFCRLFGDKTLYEQTEERASSLLPIDHLMPVVTARTSGSSLSVWQHKAPSGWSPARESWYRTCHRLRVLPVMAEEPAADVVVFPSDHFISDEARFMEFVADSFGLVGSGPGRIILLGVQARTPETQYGWIEPETPAAHLGPAMPARRFYEKPSRETAVKLWKRG